MIEPDKIFSANVEKINELQPHVRYAAMSWMKFCWAHEWYFTITECFRTQARQNMLFEQGRTRPGPIVTWTRFSLHTQRLAADVYPVGNTRYTDLIQAASASGISHPLGSKDMPHFEFNLVPAEIPKPTLEHVEHAIEHAQPPRLNLLQRLLKRLQRN